MKYLLILFVTLNLIWNSAEAQEKPILEKCDKHFRVFYPHLGNSICRKKAFDIIFD